MVLSLLKITATLFDSWGEKKIFQSPWVEAAVLEVNLRESGKQEMNYYKDPQECTHSNLNPRFCDLPGGMLMCTALGDNVNN